VFRQLRSRWRTAIFKQILLAIGLLLTHLPAWAVELYLWKADPQMPEVVIVAKTGEAPDKALDRYYRDTLSRPYAKDLFPDGENRPPGREFILLTAESSITSITTGSKMAPIDRRVLLISSKGSDLYVQSRVQNWQARWAAVGETSYLLPPGATISLSPSERSRAHELLIEHFPFWNGMGGRDWHPSTYGERNRHSVNPILEQDRMELELLQDGLRSNRIVYTGACRGGVQALCIAMRRTQVQGAAQSGEIPFANSMIQSIVDETNSMLRHENSSHAIELLETSQGIFKKMFPEGAQLTVNSLHHQAVQVDPRSGLEVAARSADGIVEALELRNGRAMAFQFHHELMPDETGNRIMQGLADHKRAVLAVDGCRKAFGSGADR
jgi:putative glutamine amidotransferase